MLDINLICAPIPISFARTSKRSFRTRSCRWWTRCIELDKKNREAIQRADYLRSQRNTHQQADRRLMAKGQREEAEAGQGSRSRTCRTSWRELEKKEEEYAAEIRKRMLVIPQIIDPSVPIGKDDSENVENERFGEPVVPELEIPYHVDIMERLNGIDLDAARRTSGNGFYYLKGDIARLHSAILSYARDFMIDRGFTYYIPPFMIRSQRGQRRHVLCRDGEHDVQDRGRGSVPDRHLRALHDRQVHRHHSRRGASCRRR